MQDYQHRFIQFLIAAGALTFGDFVTKSGRKTPYFVNTGRFDSGERIADLGGYYAHHIVANKLAQSDLIFGPAYKGIPLAVSTAIALAREHGRNVGFSFNRKEAKDHGDGGTIVGSALKPGQKIVIVEDVITAGTTLAEIVPWLTATAQVDIAGVVIAVDRCERGSGKLSAVAETKERLGVSIFPLITVHQIIEHLESSPSNGSGAVPADAPKRIRSYLEEYGA